MVKLSEMTILWYSLLHHFHMMRANHGVINKGSSFKKLVRTIRTFEYQNIMSGVKWCDYRERKTVYLTNHIHIPGPYGHFQIKVCLILIVLQMDQ